MINEIFLGLAGCFLLGSCYLFKKSKKKNKYKNNIIHANKISAYPNPHFNPPKYNENIFNNPLFMNNNQIVYEQNPPPEYSEN